ncbi:hypothetical protein HC928_13180 [bacterium]|nr:hypothetical protein [bacterium]
MLRDEKPEVYQEKCPDNLVKVNRLNFDSKEHPDLALAVEAAENEKRRDYSPSEVRAIAERLRTAGYEDVKGRPRKGQKPLMPALTVVVGKHLRTVQRYFSSESEESTTDVTLSEARHRTLKQALTKLKAWQKHEPQTVKEKKLAQELPKLLRLIEAVLQQDNVD